MPYTLGQAAKATGKQKSTILDAIRAGRLSATRDDKKQWQIDPAELHRVYAPAVQANDTEHEETPPNNSYIAQQGLLRPVVVVIARHHSCGRHMT